MLVAAGIRPAEDLEGSRKLIFDTVEGGHRLVVMRGSDVPTYVEHGGADVGIVGKDTLLEYGGSGFYERLDLGIGRCRLMTAAPAGQGLGSGPIRVATKFVRSARRYFESHGRQVRIIPLSGAMEQSLKFVISLELLLKRCFGLRNLTVITHHQPAP